jgi:hypothetical protein
MLRIIMQLHTDIMIKITRKKFRRFHIRNRREWGFITFFPLVICKSMNVIATI